MRAALGLLGFLAVGVNAPAMARDDDEGLAAKDRTATALQMPGVKRSAGADEGRRAGKAAASGKDDDDEREGGAKQEDKLDTEDIFGFTEGSSIGEAGEKEISTDFIGRLSKRGATFLVPQANDDAPPLVVRARGSYAAIGNTTQLEYTVTDRFKFSLGGAFT
jgi:hypothetical protein